MLLVDGGGEPVQANLYGAFGEVLRAWGDSRNDRLGNTKEHDRATGLANHGFRYYDPATGRYLSEDPLGYEGGFNLHVYCGNDPVNKFDPLGLFEWWEFAKAFAGEVGNGVVDAGKAAIHAVSHPVQTATAIKDRAVQRYGAIYEREGALQTVYVALGDAIGYTKIAEGAYGIDIETGQPLNGTERFQKISGGVGQVAGTIAGGAAVADKLKNHVQTIKNAKVLEKTKADLAMEKATAQVLDCDCGAVVGDYVGNFAKTRWGTIEPTGIYTYDGTNYSAWTFNEIRANSVHNPGAKLMVLGPYDATNPAKSYEVIANKEGASFFNIDSEMWSHLNKKMPKKSRSDGMFDWLNAPTLDYAIKDGKRFEFTWSEPEIQKIPPDKATYREYKYLHDHNYPKEKIEYAE